jgi:hypothetical protein
MIKLRLQNRNTARRAHDVFKAIWDKEGIRGLYRGVNPTIAGYLPTWMIYFTVYDSSKKYYTQRLSNNIVLSHILSALQAGLASTILTNPLWVARSNFHLSSSNHDPATARFSSSSVLLSVDSTCIGPNMSKRRNLCVIQRTGTFHYRSKPCSCSVSYL